MHAPVQRQDAHPLLGLEAVIVPELVGQRGRDIVGRLVESPIALLRLARCTGGGVGLHLGPQRLVGGAYLAGRRAGQLRRQAKLGPHIHIGPLLQADRVAHLAMREGVATHEVQRVAVGQLRLPQRAKLVRRRVQFELGGQGGSHANSRSCLHQNGKRRLLTHVDEGGPPTSCQGGAVLPTPQGGGILRLFW
jgi:hypothetical protein